jgi:hypothetical protein
MASESMPTAGGPTGGMDNVASLLTLNNLNYQLPNDLSVAVARTHTNEFFQAKQFSPGQTMVAIINSGSSYVRLAGSYLRLDITNTGTGPMNFGPTTSPDGNATGLFERLLISGRDGSVLERIDSVGMLSRIRGNYEVDGEYRASVMGVSGAIYTGATVIDAGESIRVVIPMSAISPMWGSEQLAPNSLISGLRVEFQLATANKAFYRTTGALELNYSIDDCAIVCESYSLSDLVLRTLNQISSSSGLEFIFNTYFTTADVRTTTSVNLESRKSVSRALQAIYVEQEQKTAALEANRDSYASRAPDFVESQFRVGSMYYPQQPLRAPEPDLLSPELYAYSLLGFSKYGRGNTGRAASSFSSFLTHTAIVAASLERDTLGGSGIPLSNSRVLQFSSVFETAGATVYNVWLFLKYTTLVRVYLSNLIVET